MAQSDVAAQYSNLQNEIQFLQNQINTIQSLPEFKTPVAPAPPGIGEPKLKPGQAQGIAAAKEAAKAPMPQMAGGDPGYAASAAE